MREKVLERKSDTNVKHYSMHALMKNNIILSRSMQETLRIVDAREAEKKCGEMKLGHKYDFVNKEV